MKNDSLKLFIKFDKKEIFIVVAEIDEQNNFKVIEKLILPLIGLSNNKISDIEKVTDIIQRNILVIEQKVKFTFKELILILDNFDISFLNFTGFKKLDGSQISKENITYIINSLKSCVDKFENKKKILHIFNSKYFLDEKEMDNLPIGLFGDFYSHELSFNLINKNDYKNLKNIFDKCNLKISKILLESFVKGSLISEKNPLIDSFFHIKIDEEVSKIFYIENDSVKYEQEFNFGTNIILKDISKIISLKSDVVQNIIEENSNLNKASNNELLEKNYFHNLQYRKIKKRLIYEIAEARIKEICNLLCIKNINTERSLNKVKVIFLEIYDKKHLNCFKEAYEHCFALNNKFEIIFFDKPDDEKALEMANKIVQFGWKKEAIPVSKPRKSLISRIFQELFH